MIQSDIFTTLAIQSNREDSSAKELTEEAIRRAGEHANEEWKMECIEAIRDICIRKQEFTMDDVWDALRGSECHTEESRALGAIILEAARRKYCRNTGRYIKSRLKVRHSRPIQIWESLLYNVNTEIE